MAALSELSVATAVLTALDGEQREVVDGVGLSVQRLGRADDSAEGVHVEEPLQVCVPVDGVTGHTHTHTLRVWV